MTRNAGRMRGAEATGQTKAAAHERRGFIALSGDSDDDPPSVTREWRRRARHEERARRRKNSERLAAYAGRAKLTLSPYRETPK
jgi:hypothetical protein